MAPRRRERTGRLKRWANWPIDQSIIHSHCLRMIDCDRSIFSPLKSYCLRFSARHLLKEPWQPSAILRAFCISDARKRIFVAPLPGPLPSSPPSRPSSRKVYASCPVFTASNLLPFPLFPRDKENVRNELDEKTRQRERNYSRKEKQTDSTETFSRR